MPRGNLETIHSRTLVITKLKDNIEKYEILKNRQKESNNFYYLRLKYKDTVESMRKNRINMNLMYDHNPKVDNI